MNHFVECSGTVCTPCPYQRSALCWR